MSGVSPEAVLDALSEMLLADGGDAGRCEQFCIGAAGQVTGMLRDENDADNPIVVNAAACLAYYRVCLSEYLSGGSVQSFKAGDISYSSSSKDMIQTAESLAKLALADAAPFLRDSDFCFTAIP